MVETSVRGPLTLPHMEEPSEYRPDTPKPRRTAIHKSIRYGPDCNLYQTIIAIARYEKLSVAAFLKHLGYTSSSVHGAWLSRSRCPARVPLLIKGWLSEKNLVAVYSQKTAGMRQDVVIQKAGAPEKTVEIQHKFVPVSVPLTRQNVLDLIGLCVTADKSSSSGDFNGEQRLILVLASLLADKYITLKEG